MAAIPGVNIIAPVVPFSTADVHPTHEAAYGKGGFRSVATHAERDAIPQPRREAGMLVYTANDGKTWRLLSDLAAWVEATGVSSLSQLTDCAITAPQDGDLLRYSAAQSKFTNYPTSELLDGGNF
jgi:hypothetical protein